MRNSKVQSRTKSPIGRMSLRHPKKKMKMKRIINLERFLRCEREGDRMNTFLLKFKKRKGSIRRNVYFVCLSAYSKCSDANSFFSWRKANANKMNKYIC